MKSACISVLCLGLFCGCSALDLSKGKSFWPVGQEKPQQPGSIAAIWTEGVVHSAAGVPTRGFAGRIIFYGPDEKKPVKVDGTLSVYTFDEAGRGKSDTKPDRKYVFTPEQLANHYDPVKVGPAYAVWVPWDEAGGSRKEISMIVRFVPRKGELVVGEMTRLVLSGPAPASDNVAASASGNANPPADRSMVRPAAYESPIHNRPGELPAAARIDGGIRSTTIPLPDSLTRHLSAVRPANTAGVLHQGRTAVVPGGVATASAGRMPLTASAQTPAANSPTVPSAFQASRPSVLSGAHSPLARPRVPGVPIAPLTRDHAPSRQPPAAPPSSLEPTPPPGPPPEGASTFSEGR